jgi:hypothetical protein
MIERLTFQKEFRVFVPDITLEKAIENKPYVLRVLLPEDNCFLEVLRIDDPISSVVPGVRLGTPVVAYAFLCDSAASAKMRRLYITSVFAHRAVPWHPQCDGSAFTPHCEALGITVHSGVPIFHVGVSVDVAMEEPLEQELVERGYELVGVKPYTNDEQLVQLYNSHRDAIKGKSP